MRWWMRCKLEVVPRLLVGFNQNRNGSLRWISTSEPGTTSKRFAALWGNGDFGRLGLGTPNSQWTPTICTAFQDYNNSVCSISCGGAHTLFLSENGRVSATGLNDFGQLGISDKKAYTFDPLEVSSLPDEVIQISAGYYHSAAVTVNGELYMWGKNSSGQLGLGKSADKIVYSPTRVDWLKGTRIKKIALGSEHSVAITDDGAVLSWGAGGAGRLGHGHQSGYLGENGSLFLFGEKTVDKFGFGDAKSAQSPYVINELPSCHEVACGGYHTGVITSGGELYTWGSNENGCLGIGSSSLISLPRRVEGPLSEVRVCEIACGWKHSAAISDDGKIFTWGWGGSNGTFSVDGQSSGGQLGHGTDIDNFEPKVVSFNNNNENNVKAVQVSCGFNHTGAVFDYTSC
ncbi:hypothetical protein MKW94_030961 [Papaver nudicaule]|uniref:RCC1-like domain-containing protein n=1 Tax=Papaver nudicaule TaxID=74823 RepID=A0AA41S2X8_PAPNU|nr:hypothetical protein [Papaver nudicaule]